MLSDDVIKIVQDILAYWSKGCGLPLAWRKDLLSFATEDMKHGRKDFEIFERIHKELCPTK